MSVSPNDNAASRAGSGAGADAGGRAVAAVSRSGPSEIETTAALPPPPPTSSSCLTSTASPHRFSRPPVKPPRAMQRPPPQPAPHHQPTPSSPPPPSPPPPQPQPQMASVAAPGAALRSRLLRRSSSFGVGPMIVVAATTATMAGTGGASEPLGQPQAPPARLRESVCSSPEGLTPPASPITQDGSSSAASTAGPLTPLLQPSQAPALAEVAINRGSKRWVVLMLTGLLLFGNFYAYDNPAALNQPLQKYLGHSYDTWQYELNLLYSVYSLPNTVLPFFGGQLADRADARAVLLGFSLCVCVGQAVFAAGVSARSFALMAAGRVLFGIGGECVSVVQASITTAWFGGRELAFALGLNLAVSRLGSVANALVSPRVELHAGAAAAVWGGALACGLSFACACALCQLIGPPARKPPPAPLSQQQQQQQQAKLGPARFGRSEATAAESAEVSGSSDDRGGGWVEDENCDDEVDNNGGGSGGGESEPLLSRRVRPRTRTYIGAVWSYLSTKAAAVAATVSAAAAAITAAAASAAADVRRLPMSFWMICLLCILLYGTVIPFNNMAADFLMSKWYPGDTVTAGLVMSIPDSMSAVLVPLSGYFVDRYGYRASLLTVCSAAIVAAHATLGASPATWSPVPPLVLLGLSYSIYGVALWPSVATVVLHHERRCGQRRRGRGWATGRRWRPWRRVEADGGSGGSNGGGAGGDGGRDDDDGSVSDDSVRDGGGHHRSGAPETDVAAAAASPRLLGTAYGLATAALNTALTVMPVAAAEVHVASGTYATVEALFALLAACGVVVACLLWAADGLCGGLLQRPELGALGGAGVEEIVSDISENGDDETNA